jgi:hypothetical protein
MKGVIDPIIKKRLTLYNDRKVIYFIYSETSVIKEEEEMGEAVAKRCGCAAGAFAHAC